MSLRFPRLLLLCLLVFAVSLPLWRALIAYNWQIISAECISPGAKASAQTTSDDWNYSACGNVIHGADTQEYYYYFESYPDKIEKLKNSFQTTEIFFENIGTEYYKRPLFGAISTSLGLTWHQITGISFPERAFDVLALYSALSTTLIFLIFLRCGASVSVALLSAIVASTSYAWLTVLSIPESYSLSVCAALIVLYSGIRLQQQMRGQATIPLSAVLRHLAIVIIASNLYLPNFGAMAFLLGVRTKRLDSNVKLIGVSVITAILVLVPQFILLAVTGGMYGPADQISYGFEWGSTWNFLNPVVWIDSIAAFSVFSIVPASFPLLHVGGGIDWSVLVTDKRMLPVFALGVALSVAAAWFVWRAWRPSSWPFVIWLAGLVVFHTFYNPGEVLLYNAVPFTVLVGLIAWSMASTPPIPGSRRVLAVGAMATAASTLR